MFLAPIDGIRGNAKTDFPLILSDNHAYHILQQKESVSDSIHINFVVGIWS